MPHEPNTNGQAKTITVSPRDVLGRPKTRGYVGADHRWWRRPRDLPVFTWEIIDAMLLDPTIRLGLAMREAPLIATEFGQMQNGQFQPGIEASSDEVAVFVQSQLESIWRQLPCLLSAQAWGWAAAEVCYEATDGQVTFSEFLPRHSRDTKCLEQDGELVGVQFERVERENCGGKVGLLFPKCVFHAFAPEPGQFYGTSVLIGCLSPWADKWLDGGALDVRRLFMHKDAYGGADIGYPPGTTDIDGKGEVPNRDIAREIVEQMTAGGVTARPSTIDPDTGKEMWPLTRATVPANPQHILQYPKDLDVEILRGMEISDDVLTAEQSGAWAGKLVPMQAFYAGLERWRTLLLAKCIVPQVLEPLVVFNFGKNEWFHVACKPLAQQAMEQQNGPQQPPAAGGGIPGMPEGGSPLQMSLDAQVGRGILDAAKVVQNARELAKASKAIRMAGRRRPGTRLTRALARAREAGNRLRTGQEAPASVWQPFRGTHGGRGWRHSVTGEVRYQEQRPQEQSGTPQQPAEEESGDAVMRGFASGKQSRERTRAVNRGEALSQWGRTNDGAWKHSITGIVRRQEERPDELSDAEIARHSPFHQPRPYTPPTPKPEADKPAVQASATPRQSKAKINGVTREKKRKWDEMFGGKIPFEAAPSLVGAPDDANVDVIVGEYSVSIHVKHPSFESCSRQLCRDEQTGKWYCKNAIFALREDAKGNGIGTTVLHDQATNLQALGFTAIKTHAAGSYVPDKAEWKRAVSLEHHNEGSRLFPGAVTVGDLRKSPEGKKWLASKQFAMNGYYTWPALGYDQQLKGTLSRRQIAEAQQIVPGAQSVLDLMATPEGSDWWLKNGTDLTDATLDLTPGSRSMMVLTAKYAEGQAKKAAKEQQQPAAAGRSESPAQYDERIARPANSPLPNPVGRVVGGDDLYGDQSPMRRRNERTDRIRRRALDARAATQSRRDAANAQTQPQAPPRAERQQRPHYEGHAATAVARWMGRDGWSHADAVKVFRYLGIPISPNTLREALPAGRQGIRGTPAELSEAQAERLRNIRAKKMSAMRLAKAGKAKPPAAREEPDVIGDDEQAAWDRADDVLRQLYEFSRQIHSGEGLQFPDEEDEQESGNDDDALNLTATRTDDGSLGVKIEATIRATRLAAAHAPKGGIVIGGQRFEGGEFIPGEVMAKATAEEKRGLDGSESEAPRSRSNLLDRISFKDGLTINGNVYAKGDVIPFDEWYAAKTKAMNGTPDKKLIEVLDKMKKVGQPTRQRFTGQERAGAGNVRWINLDEVRFPQPLSEEVSPMKSNKDKPIIVTKTEDGFKLLDGFGRASGMKNYGNERVFAIVVTKGDIAENEGSSDDPVWGRRMYKRYAPSISYSESEN